VLARAPADGELARTAADSELARAGDGDLVRGWVAAGWLALVATGCGSCEEAPAVPFKLDQGTAPTTAPLQPPDAGTSTASDDAFAPREGRAYGDGTRRVALEGGVLELGEGSVRASLDVDLDGDHKLDALLVTVDATGAPRLATAARMPEGYAVPAPVAALAPGAERCVLEAILLRQFAPGFASLRGEIRCATSLSASTAAAGAPPGAASPAPPAPQPGDGAPTSAATSATPSVTTSAVPAPMTQHLWIVALAALPRVASHLAWSAPLRPESGVLVLHDVALSHGDFDADGHGDVEARFAFRRTLDSEPATLALRFFDRPAGLARDPTEPETTLRSLTDKARDKLRRDPAGALAGADRVLALYSALCREGGEPMVRFDEVDGIPCGRSRAAGRAMAIRVAGLARTGAVPTAIEALAALASDAYDVPRVDHDRVREAFAAVATKDRAWRKGPALAPTPGPRAQLSAVAFLDEDTLLLRGASPRRFAIGEGSTSPDVVDADTRITDPSGRLVAVEVFRACDGYHLRTVPSAQVVGALVGVASASEPLLVAAPPPPGARCPGPLAPSVRDDRGRFRVLDWTERGVLLARGGELWRLALDTEGMATAPALPVPPAEGARPRRPGALGEDGRHLALASELGVAIVERATGRTVFVPFAGSELESPGPRTTTDVAVSPSGRRAAIVHAGHVFVAIEAAATAPAPDAPPASTSTAPAPDAPPASTTGATAAPPASPPPASPASPTAPTPPTSLPPPAP
jgi:hypothetical protein